jgi:hypothetical protein
VGIRGKVNKIMEQEITKGKKGKAYSRERPRLNW